MTPRPRPPAPNPNQASQVLGDHNDRIALSNLLRPWFRWDEAGVSNDSVWVRSKPTLAGDERLLIPFRSAPVGVTTRNPLVLASAPDTLIDLSTTGLGGRVDGIALTASTDYLLWAFASPAEAPVFIGFGITARPVVATTSITGTGAVGSSTTFNFAAGSGYRFVNGARVLIRVSDAIGAAYNQGTITAVASGSITVTLDAAYTVGTQANATVAHPLTVIQLDKFAPTVPSQATTYGATTTTPYQYAYMGMLMSDAASGLFGCRVPGEVYPLSPTTAVSTAVASAGTEVILARWIPIGLSVAEFGLSQAVGGTPGAAAVNSRLDHPDGSVRGLILQADGTNVTGFTSLANGLVSIRPRYSSVRYLHTIGGLATSTLTVGLRGYYEDKW